MEEKPDLDKLRGKLAEAHLSQADIARKLRMSPATLSNKMRGIYGFSVFEAGQIMKQCNEAKPGTFSGNDLIAIFFPWI